ncbi:hypothetical protein PGB90_006742 [Kerria lacca]
MWAWALQFAVGIHNKHLKLLNGKCPYTEFLQKSRSLKYYRHFGCLTHVFKNSKLSKFEERTIKGFLVGCNDDSYTVYIPYIRKFKKFKNVDFVENKVYGDVFNKNKTNLIFENEGSEKENEFWKGKIENSPSKLIETINLTETNWVNFFENSKNNFVEVLNLENEPTSYEEAITCKDSEKWKAAINEDLESINKNNTWCLIEKNKINS